MTITAPPDALASAPARPAPPNPAPPSDLPRADYFWSLSSAAHRIADAMHREMAVREATAALAGAAS